MKAYWISVSIVSFVLGGCCGSAICDEPSLQAAKSQLNSVKNPLDAIKELTENTSAVETEEAKNDTHLQTPADVVLPVDIVSTPPVITFQKTVGASDSLVRQKSTVTDYWMVSESWCANCPAAKKRFLDSGRPADHVITIAQAKQLHGRIINSVPAEYTTSEVRETINPPTYREQHIMQVTLNGSSKPSRESILAHLRGGGPHQGKHWQAWHLESWRTPQLYALHDDDHAGTVPTFETESAVVATVEGGSASPELFAAVLAGHLMESSGQETDDSPVLMGGLFDFTINVEDSWKRLATTILTTRQAQFPSAGITIDWGAEQTLKKTRNAITIQPPVKVTARKWVFNYSAALNGVRYADDLSSVTLDLTGAPDVTINLVSK